MRKANKYKKIRTILRSEFGNTLLTCDRYNLSEQVMYLMIDKNIPIVFFISYRLLLLLLIQLSEKVAG